METKDFNKEYTERGAYHHTLKAFKALWYNRNYELLSDGVHGNVLDIACGDGRLADFLCTPRTSLDGFDASARAIQLAGEKKVYRNLWVGNIVNEDNYRRNQYDFFICSLSLQYLTEKELKDHFDFISTILSGHNEYRFSFPNSKNVPSPNEMINMLKLNFTHISAKTITGFIDSPDELDQKEVKRRFLESQNCPVQDSYHYMIILKKE